MSKVRVVSMRTICSTLLLVGLSFSLGGCVKRQFYTPRSELLADAESRGEPVRTQSEERELFFENERLHYERLVKLIEQRTAREFRDPNYRIGAGDELEINVFDVPELNLTARVRQSGFMSLPLIGGVEVLGRTEAEVTEDLTKRLRSYVRNPQVSVFISHYGSQRVAVMGAVQTPGTYPLKKGSNSLLELVSEAGGVNQRAGNILNFIPSELSGLSASNEVEARARLALASIRADNPTKSAIQLYLDQVMGSSGGIPLEIPVRGGDMIVVPDAGKVLVEGEVREGGSYDLGPGMTLLGALAAAGGITYSAKVDEVEIIREVRPGERAHLVLALPEVAFGKEDDIRLRDGDIVRIPSDSGRRLTEETFDGLSRIIRFGVGGNVNLAN